MNDSNWSKKEAVATPDDNGQIVVPLLGEDVAVTKEKRNTGRVQVTTVTGEREELVDELLSREQVEVERAAIGKPIEVVPSVREEGDTLIIPIVEEVLVIDRRLVLKEEVRIRRVHNSERHQELVTLRQQEAIITRLPADNRAGQANLISKERSEDRTQEKK